MVKPGDDLNKIASFFNVTPDFLEKININTNNLYPGMQIIVPSTSNGYMVYKVKKGDTLYGIANEYGVELKNLLYLNGLNETDFIYPDQEILIPQKDLEIYMTIENDTLGMVAKKLNASIKDIVNQNATIYLEVGQPILYKREK